MSYKLFVFDLDETVWTVSEGLCSLIRPPYHLRSPDRLETDEGFWVELKPGVHKLFDFLQHRGKYISVASRNDPGATKDLLGAFGLLELLAFPQFGWRPKEESIQRIIRAIQKRDRVSIKPREVFFLDDWPENVAPVRSWGATALIFGQDVADYTELIKMLK